MRKFESILNIPQTTISENEISPRKTEDSSWKPAYYNRMTLMLRFVSGYPDTAKWLKAHADVV